jgi:hypothetical protein
MLWGEKAPYIAASVPLRDYGGDDARRNDLVGTFLWIQSKRANDISLRAAKNVADTKLSSAKSI